MSKDVIVEDRCCLDTDVLIDVSRKKVAAIAFLEQKEKESEVCCSIVSNFEMISGARNKQFESFLNSANYRPQNSV